MHIGRVLGELLNSLRMPLKLATLGLVNRDVNVCCL